MDINTSHIFKAMQHYEGRGYKMIAVPMIVDEAASQLTKPAGCADLYHYDKVYVASAEQSFIQLYNEGELLPGKYMALTPCYRDEAVLDELHFNIFLKLELIHVFSISADCEYYNMLYDAELFIATHFNTVPSRTITDCGSVDLEIAGIEIGSYGRRQFADGTSYTYGTGIAEPRLSSALRKENERNKKYSC